MNASAIPLSRHKLTVNDYHQMARVGILAPDARVELIEGEIIDMAPIGSAHGSVVDRLVRLFDRAIGERAIVRAQGSILLNGYTEPEPDIALLKYRADFYRDALPTSKDVVLLVEVAESTLAYDSEVKAPLYARGEIAEYWLVDLVSRQITFHADPVKGLYRDVHTTGTPGRTPIRALEAISVDLTGLI
jgi:Uma2 family endonuclease